MLRVECISSEFLVLRKRRNTLYLRWFLEADAFAGIFTVLLSRLCSGIVL